MHNLHIYGPDENHPKPSDSMVKSEKIISPWDMTMVLGRRQAVIISTEDEYYRLLDLGHPELNEDDFFTRTINTFAITCPKEILDKRLITSRSKLQP